MRKLNKKGFTLVEIVIVIVIIAILAAMLVPALTQWIKKSKIKTFTSACATIKTAVWAQAAESYGTTGGVNIDWGVVSNDVGKTVGDSTGDYVVSNFDFAADTITIKDKNNYVGEWDKAASTWNVTAP